MIRPVFDQAAGELGREIVLEPREPQRNGDRRFAINGRLVHQFPAPLEDVRVILVHQPRRLGWNADDLFVDTYTGAVALWPAGEELDLDKAIELTQGINTGVNGLLERIIGSQARELGIGGPSPTALGDAALGSEMMGVSLFQAFPPPDYDSPSSRRSQVAMRSSTYGLDLSRWLSQPCIIVIGRMENVPSPIPVSVDGNNVSANMDSGQVVVRWVYPLPAMPVQVPADAPASAPTISDPAGPQ
jgi:hypothetical protein